MGRREWGVGSRHIEPGIRIVKNPTLFATPASPAPYSLGFQLSAFGDRRQGEHESKESRCSRVGPYSLLATPYSLPH
jgi:hypothetical protein